jgi:predicted nucleic acid-binding protein
VPQFQYLDASAIVKLVLHEPESTALRRHLRRTADAASSGLAWAEVPRAVRRSEPTALQRVQPVLDRLLAVAVTPDIIAQAARLDPSELRTLDAIHVVSAASLGSDLASLVTYDARMAAAAVARGLSVVSPR